ncbi:MAG: peptide chain release factor 2, partial [Deltaproteobacteria bacterium]|nr:peptide chain release factor 2 [Deltaproteobacteria bacterium]
KSTLKEKSTLQQSLQTLHDAETCLSDVHLLIELATEDCRDENLQEVVNEITRLQVKVRAIEIDEMLGGPNDSANAILSINAGAGGTEAQDWAQMLLRMYLRYCENRNFRTQLVDTQSGEEAGIKSATFTIQGAHAYGLLKAEVGVHRLVRISPFDANHRRHTSFASVFVFPDIEEDIEIEVQEKDLRIDTFRAGGAGGQHVNKTDSAVRLTHFPTGIVVQCQNERSQHQNKALAMKILKARLYEKELEKKAQERQALEDTKKEIAWGSQIRSYVLHPYRLIKDHRTNLEVGDVDSVLDGELQTLIETYLMSKGTK